MQQTPPTAPTNSSCPVNTRVVLVRPEGAINVGSVARLCGNLGADLWLVDPQCDVFGSEARMFALHAAARLRRENIVRSIGDAVADCDWVVGSTARRRRDFLLPQGPEEVAQKIVARNPRKVGLLFGSESHGLSRDDLQHCDELLHLDAPGGYSSYNLSHAVGIVLYLLRAPRDPATVKARELGSHHQREQLFELWLQVLQRAGYFRRTQQQRFAATLRRLIGRLELSSCDVNTMRGMLVHLQQSLEDTE